MIGAPPLEAQVVHSLHGLPPDAAIIAAVSGGADSTALLAALAALRDRGAGYALHCAHVNHNLRGEESLADARAVEQLCKDFDIPCHIETIAEGRIEKRARETGSGIEAAAREARRRALRRTALRCHADAILIAHTKNDLLENIIIRVLRGAGPAGLSPIQAKNGIIIRPLLNLTRGAILDYLDARGLTHQTDSTNNDDRHLRNKVRRHIIPILDQRFPDWAQNLQRAAETQRLVASHLKDQAQEIISGAQHRPDGALVIPNLSSHHRIVQEETIFCAINSLQQRAEPAFQPDQRQRKIAAPRRATIRKAIETRKTTQLPGGTLAFTDGGAVISPTKSPNFEEGYALLAERDGVPTVITHEGG